MNRGTKWLGAVAVAGLVVGLLGSRTTAAGRPGVDGPPDSPPYAYHLRVVRIAGASDYRGAALGCGRSCGRPIVVPAEEAWGTPAQLEGLARALGGERADAVTGFIVLPGTDGAAHFEGTVYPGEAVVGLAFSAQAPSSAGAPHDLSLTVTANDGGEPLVEARVLSASGRTIALVAPSPVEGEWLALAVTTLDPAAAEAIAAAGAPIEQAGGRITLPELIERVMPRYTPQAREEGRHGKVVINSVIDAAGRVRAPRVLWVDPGIEDLAASAVEAVGQWRYRPGTRYGMPVAVHFTIMVEFVLE